MLKQKIHKMADQEEGSISVTKTSVNQNDKIKKVSHTTNPQPPKKASFLKIFLYTLLAFGGIAFLIYIIGTSISPTNYKQISTITAKGNTITINGDLVTPTPSKYTIVATTTTRDNVKLSINVTGWFGQGFILNGRVAEIPGSPGSSTPPGTEAIISGKYIIFGDTKINVDTGIFFGEPVDSENNLSDFSKALKNIGANINPEVAGLNPFLIIINLLPILFMIMIAIFAFKSLKSVGGVGGGGSSLFSVGKSGAKLVKSDVLFKDVAGIIEEKEELAEVVDYLKYPAKYIAMGARTPKGIILYGPPGTGKTLLAKAVAGEANVPFFFISGSGFEDMLVGVGAKRVKDLFKRASAAAPSIIFIDEIDSVASKRSKFDVSSGIGDQTINQLLAEMDGFTQNAGVVVIAATNRLESLDDAILRPGRFDRHIQVNLPDIKERIEILNIHAKNKNISSAVNLKDIARRTPGFSGAQLENVLNEAAILAVRENKQVISLKMIDEAVDRVIAGPAKKSRVISEEERKLIAYHEGGHAVVGLHTKGSDVVEKITIIPRGRAAGYTVSVPREQELTVQKKSDLLGIIRMSLGGRAAEELIYGKLGITTGASNDLYKVTNIVRAMVTQMGMSSELGMTQFIPSEGVDTRTGVQKFYSNETALRIDAEINKIINIEYQNAIRILQENRQELELIVETLLAIETITREEIDFIHKYKKIPKIVLEEKENLSRKGNISSPQLQVLKTTTHGK